MITLAVNYKTTKLAKLVKYELVRRHLLQARHWQWKLKFSFKLCRRSSLVSVPSSLYNLSIEAALVVIQVSMIGFLVGSVDVKMGIFECES